MCGHFYRRGSGASTRRDREADFRADSEDRYSAVPNPGEHNRRSIIVAVALPVGGDVHSCPRQPPNPGNVVRAVNGDDTDRVLRDVANPPTIDPDIHVIRRADV